MLFNITAVVFAVVSVAVATAGLYLIFRTWDRKVRLRDVLPSALGLSIVFVISSLTWILGDNSWSESQVSEGFLNFGIRSYFFEGGDALFIPAILLSFGVALRMVRFKVKVVSSLVRIGVVVILTWVVMYSIITLKLALELFVMYLQGIYPFVP